MLIAGSESQLQELLNTVVDASLHTGLSINIKKTQFMVISKTKITPTCHIHINNETIKQVEKFKNKLLKINLLTYLLIQIPLEYNHVRWKKRCRN